MKTNIIYGQLYWGVDSQKEIGLSNKRLSINVAEAGGLQSQEETLQDIFRRFIPRSGGVKGEGVVTLPRYPFNAGSEALRLLQRWGDIFLRTRL